MSDPLLTPPGFWGKLPATGDFVGRRLSPAFVQRWDRFVTRHLVHRLADDAPLRFAFGGMTGVVLASADRAGRRFPLTLAAAAPAPAPPDWYAALEAVGRAAVDGSLDPAALDTRLATLPPPSATEAGPTALRLATAATPWRTTDPDAPDAALDALFGAATEAG